MIHCNIGYCTTLLYNEDVALKSFLYKRRPTRLNHIILVAQETVTNRAYNEKVMGFFAFQIFADITISID